MKRIVTQVRLMREVMANRFGLPSAMKLFSPAAQGTPVMVHIMRNFRRHIAVYIRKGSPGWGSHPFIMAKHGFSRLDLKDVGPGSYGIYL